MCHAGPRLLSVQVCLYKFDRNSPKLLGVKGDSSALDIAREGDPIPPELEIDALRAHPRFAEAMRACARNTIDYHGRGRMIGPGIWAERLVRRGSEIEAPPAPLHGRKQ